MNNVQEQYRKFSLIILIVGIGIVLFLEFRPFLNGILGAFTIYILVRNQLLFFTEKKGMKQGWAALILLIETILLFLIPISLTAWLLVNKLQHFNVDTSMIMDTAQHVAELIQQKTGYNILDRTNLLKAASYLPQIGQFLMGSISGLAMNLVVLLFFLYFMLISGRKMEQYFYTILPFSNKNKITVLKEIHTIVSSNAIGIPLLAVIQGIIAFIGYLIFQVPEPVVFGFLTCIATIIPIVGTGLIWLPLAIYMALTGNWVSAIGLILFGILVISNIDNMIRLMLQKKLADTHPLITVFGVIIGLSLFGFMGIIFGPLLIAFFLLCVNIFKEEYLESKEELTLHPRVSDQAEEE